MLLFENMLNKLQHMKFRRCKSILHGELQADLLAVYLPNVNTVLELIRTIELYFTIATVRVNDQLRVFQIFKRFFFIFMHELDEN